MADPLRYFGDPQERELAREVWDLAAKRTTFYSTICRVNQYRFTSPDAHRLVYAKDWLTYWRQDGGSDDNANVNRQLGHPVGYYSGECIADVEHFFTAAFMGIAIGPSLTQLGSAGWETFDILLKNPVLKAGKAYTLGDDVSKAFFDGFPHGWRGWWTSVKWNYGQLLGTEQSGLVFASELPEGFAGLPWSQVSVSVAKATTDLHDAVDFVRRELSTPPPPSPEGGAPPAGKSPVAPKPGVPVKEFRLDFGDPNKRSLSAIAKGLYGSFDLWPLIWWQNPDISNPNRLQGKRSVRYRDLSTYTSGEIAAAKAAAPTWKNYPP
jgi:hypothetical protein